MPKWMILYLPHGSKAFYNHGILFRIAKKLLKICICQKFFVPLCGFLEKPKLKV